MNLNQLLPRQEDQDLFSRVELKRIGFLLETGSFFRSGRFVLGMIAAAALLLLTLLNVRAAVAHVPYNVFSLQAERIAQALLSAIGLAFVLLNLLIAARDFYGMKGHLLRGGSPNQDLYARECLLVTRRFFLYLVVFLGLATACVLLFLKTMQEFSERGAMAFTDLYGLFPLLWIVGLFLNLQCLILLFTASANAGIVLKLHLVKTGKDRIEL